MQPFSVRNPLPLTNAGALCVVPIGVGNAFAHRHFNTNYLLIKGDTHLLIDCGRTAPEALDQLGIDLGHITAVYITHAHSDHVGGLETLALTARYRFGRKVALAVPDCFARVLWNETLHGGLANNEAKRPSEPLGFADYFRSLPIETGCTVRGFVHHVDVGSLHLEIFHTRHASGWNGLASCSPLWSTGIMVDHRLFISGDTRFDPELLSLYLPTATMAFHDTALAADPVHASIDELRTLPHAWKRSMYLIHFGDRFFEQSPEGFAGFARQGHMYTVPE
jgi:ribonuclease BN (tRNA processing enzyme)